MTGPYREQEMTPPPSRWVRFWEQMANGHKHGVSGGYSLALAIIGVLCGAAFIVWAISYDITRTRARIQAEYDASHLTGEGCLTECAAAGMRVDWYKPSTQECGCKQ